MPGPSIYALIGLAILESRQGNAEEAVKMLTAAINHPITATSYKVIAKKELDLLAAKLGSERFSAAQACGEALEFQSVIDHFNPSSIHGTEG